MKDINTLFFELIQVAIGKRICLSHTPSADEWGKLYSIAKKQSLVGICFAGVQRLQQQQQEPPEMLYLTWMGMAAKIQQKNETVNRQCVELQEKLPADGFRSYIMKGQAVGSLYRVDDCKKRGDSSTGGSDPAVEKNVENRGSLQMLRQSGDIDVYLEGGLDKVLAYARTFGEVAKVNELEMTVPVFPDTEVEFHYRPFIMRNPFKNKRLQKFFDECVEGNFSNRIKLSADSLEIVAPTTEFNLVHQMVHIYHHLFTEGIGMRQLMDYYFVLHTLSVSPLKGECSERAKKVISDLGLDKFASALMWVMQHVFGLGMIGMPWIPNQRDGEFLLKEIMLSGNFGKQDERQKGLYDSKWNSFWMVNGKALRLARFDRWMWYWGPIWRIYHFCWRKMKGFK